GIDLDRIGVAVLNFDTPEWNEPRARRIFDRVLDELRRHPSVEAASLSSGLPFRVPSTLRLSISPLEQTSAARMDPQLVTTIAGVAADTDVGSIFADPRPLAYVPLTQHYQPLITVVARASGSVTNAVGAMREAIRRADPDVAVDTIGTGRSVLAGPFQVLRGL